MATERHWGLRLDAIFVPEPSAALSLSAGAAAIGILGGQRRRWGVPIAVQAG